VTTAESVFDGLLQVETAAPAFAVVDMRLGDGNGLDVISAIKKRRPEVRAIILTGYGNIATAVNAVKLGAVDYLAKPVDADDVAEIRNISLHQGRIHLRSCNTAIIIER
jgi:two-component system response regulator RegA